MPARTFLAARNNLKLSIGLVTRLITRWSCSPEFDTKRDKLLIYIGRA